MHKKTGNDTIQTRGQTRTLSKTALRRALARPTPELAGDEEKALRMLNGGSTPRTTVLERVGQEHPDSREKLLGIELELLRQWRERRDAGRADPRAAAKATPAPAAKPAPNARREKIVQALKAKKPSR